MSRNVFSLRQVTAVPVSDAAGLSLSPAGGASATASGPVVDMPTMKDATQRHGITLPEEDISDVRWRRSMSSTRKTTQPSRAACCSLLEAAAVEAAAAGPAEVAAEPAVCHGGVASRARSAQAPNFDPPLSLLKKLKRPDSPLGLFGVCRASSVAWRWKFSRWPRITQAQGRRREAGPTPATGGGLAGAAKQYRARSSA
jgi:hypothetical protein